MDEQELDRMLPGWRALSHTERHTRTEKRHTGVMRASQIGAQARSL